MICATYDFYQNDFGGTLVPEESFTPMATKASNYIATIIGNADCEALDCNSKRAVLNACCACAETFYSYSESQHAATEHAGKTSETVGKYSVSYGGATFSDFSESSGKVQSALYDGIRMYLAGTGLLYRGINCL